MMPALNISEAREIGAREFAAVSRMIHDQTGIMLPDSKRGLVQARLAKRMRLCGLSAFADYVRLLDQDDRERDAAIDALTTNHTAFFRENHHFDHLAAEVRPGLVGRVGSGGRVRIWSAACSSGEEPYSIAMTLLGQHRGEGVQLSQRDLLILATDLSPTVLDRARRRLYPAEAVAAVPAPLGAAWLRPQGEEVEIDDSCASLVKYRELNLMGDWPIAGRFDVIFCRNVMIYFDEPTKERLQARLIERLLPGGYLYIGHSERLIGPAATQCRAIGQTIYRKVMA